MGVFCEGPIPIAGPALGFASLGRLLGAWSVVAQLLPVLLVMVVLELLSSRGSLECPAAGGSRGGRRRHFLPLLDSM